MNKENILDKNGVENNIRKITKVLQRVPEVKQACIWMIENPDSFIKIAEEYLQLMKVIDELDNKDLRTIMRAEEIMAKKGIAKKCASHITTFSFIKAIEGKVSLYKMAQSAFEARSIFYERTIKQLSEMMYSGHKMFSSGGTPKDGDQSSDSVIWGHTQMRKDVDPQIPVNFIISHFLARFFSFALKDFKIIKEKDDFFIPMSGSLLLSEAKNPHKLTIIEPWITPRGQGGLNWITEKQLGVYMSLK